MPEIARPGCRPPVIARSPRWAMTRRRCFDWRSMMPALAAGSAARQATDGSSGHAIMSAAAGTGATGRAMLAERRGRDGGAAAANVGHAGAAEWEIDALNRVLVACAEHELNASTFAARVVASTGADLYASVLAALCSLSGPIHGGACDRIEQMFARTRRRGAPGGMPRCVRPSSSGSRRASVTRFIRSGDPRAVLLRSRPPTIARRKGRKLYETALKSRGHASGKRERLRPNLDFYLTVCTRMLGFRARDCRPRFSRLGAPPDGSRTASSSTTTID